MKIATGANIVQPYLCVVHENPIHIYPLRDSLVIDVQQTAASLFLPYLGTAYHQRVVTPTGKVNVA